MRKKVTVFRAFAFLLLVSMSISFLCSCGSKDNGDIDLKGIKECQELEVAKFNFHKYIIERRTTELMRILSYNFVEVMETLILPVDVEVVGKIDFSNITNDNLVRTEDGGLTFFLPDPTLKLINLKADYKTQDKASKGNFSDAEITKIIRQAKDSIMVEKTIEMMAGRTRENASLIIIPLLAKATGVPEDKIRVEFHSDLDLSSAKFSDKDIIIFKRKD